MSPSRAGRHATPSLHRRRRGPGPAMLGERGAHRRDDIVGFALAQRRRRRARRRGRRRRATSRPAPPVRRVGSAPAARYSGCEPGNGWISSREHVVDPVEHRAGGAEVARETAAALSTKVSPRLAGTSRCRPAGSGRSTASGRRRRTAARDRPSLRSTSVSPSSATTDASSTARSTWIGSVSWNSSISSRWYRCAEPPPRARAVLRIAQQRAARARAGRGTPARPRRGVRRHRRAVNSAIATA